MFCTFTHIMKTVDDTKSEPGLPVVAHEKKTLWYLG